jgi:hypothetical protein
MSQVAQKRQGFVDKRARALAMMLLTHREDLLIEEVGDEIGLDYVVRFRTEGKEGLREFGIAVRGFRAAVTKEYADKALRPDAQRMLRYGPFSRPVCLFLFTMERDGAWFTWVVEPIGSEDGKPLLRSCDKPHCRQFDKRALKEIIERVDLWYDALFPSLVGNGPGGGKADRKGAKP